MHDLIVGEREDEVFRECVEHRECNLIMMMFTMDRITADVLQRVVYPAHIPFVPKAEPAAIDRRDTIGQAVDSSGDRCVRGKQRKTSPLRNAWNSTARDFHAHQS